MLVVRRFALYQAFFLFLIYTATVASSVISAHAEQIEHTKAHLTQKNGEILRTGVVFLWLTSMLIFTTIFYREDSMNIFAADVLSTASSQYAGMDDAEKSDMAQVPQALPPSADL